MSRPKKKGLISIILLAISLFLLCLATINQEFAAWYANVIYKGIVTFIGWLTGLIPYSLSEVALYLVGAWILSNVIYLLCRFIQKDLKSYWRSSVANLGLLLSVLFFLFTVNCGINYKQPSFSRVSDIKTEKYTVQDLKEVCVKLTQYVNELSSQVERDAQGTAYGKGDGHRQAVEAMEGLSKQYTALEGFYPQPKQLIFPEILSFQSISGIYAPFTVEANYNNDMVAYNIPFTQCHELSHLRGFMQEEEANFIAYLACRQSEDVFFQYSGSMMGWLYCMNVLHQADYDAYLEVRQQLNEYAQMDFDANSEFWEQYDGKVSDLANKINDTYLKANGQSDGVKSYDRMVDLIVVYEKFSCPSR